ncbi:hypothetical protein K7X08_027471 [Anisodus acutangulus]|uniref:Uncharacterized protein n=1 Tax=Anisodus acutangulus TaxID=402998 RepID=A0A9Q1MJF3_9SOLA|nr:hypothetical protein K7X08_027471 [Anisodus acutangulus]
MVNFGFGVCSVPEAPTLPMFCSYQYITFSRSCTPISDLNQGKSFMPHPMCSDLVHMNLEVCMAFMEGVRIDNLSTVDLDLGKLDGMMLAPTQITAGTHIRELKNSL